MSSTEENRPKQVAIELFDEAVVPLAEQRRAAGQAYFPLAGERGAKSYFVEPKRHVMSAADFEFPGGGTAEGLVEALCAAWAKEGESGLAAMQPRLTEIAAALRTEAEQGDGSVSILCYTMF